MRVPTYDTAPGAKAFSGLGERLLAGMGWRKGDGLGKHRDGLKAAIEVAKREDNAGVGRTKTRYAWDKKWWEGHYASAADKFAAAVGGQGVCASSDSSDSDSDSDDDEAELMMKLGAALGKDGIVSSGSKADLKLMEELASGNHRGSTFGGRSGKLERIAKFEAEQLAKYGVQNGAAAPPVVVTATTTVKKSSKKMKKEKTKKKKTKHAARDSDSDRSAGDIEVVRGVAYEGEPSTSTKERDWWSKAGFAWGGVVGSKREQDVRQGDDDDGDDATKSTKRGFTEDDQENLFKSAHEAGVVRGSHRGLGGKGVIKTEWQGKRKTSFDDDDDKKSRRKKDKKEKKEKKSSKKSSKK